MKYIKCANKNCGSSRIIKNGLDFRTSDSKFNQRYICKDCGEHFSNATFSSTYKQKKRRLNNKVYKLMCFGMSVSNIAGYLDINKKTVLRKLKFLAEEKKKENSNYLASVKGSIEHIEFDELLTHVHTKCKPLSVAMAVEKYTGRILGFKISESPATGKLAAISKEKYSWPNNEKKGLNELFIEITPLLAKKALIESDKKLIYKPIVKKRLTAAKINFEHIQYKGDKYKHRAQGEMKIFHKEHDPLFWINHTFAMLRYKISRLIRKTWCNTKKIENLEHHLEIFMNFHNKMIEAKINSKVQLE